MITRLALLLSFSASFAFAEVPEGFVPIFNGSDLSGWEGSADYWSVEEGALTGVTDGSLKMNRFITWKGGMVKNFELRVKVKITAGGNSGLQYRGTERPDLGDWVVTGYQCDVVQSRPDYNGMLYEERGRRILAQTGQKVVIESNGQPWVVDELQVKDFSAEGWHDYRVLVEGNHHRHWIDGRQTVDVIDLDAHGRALEGVIAVQVHVGPAMKVQYKDFWLKALPDYLPMLDAGIPVEAKWVRPQRGLPKDWSPPVRGVRWIDLTDHFRRAKTNTASSVEDLTSGGRELSGLFLHANAPEQPLSEVAFPAFALPELGDGVDGIALRLGIGFKDGESFIDAKSDGCLFTILANDEVIYRKDYATQEWLPESLDLTKFAGKEVSLTLRVDPKKSSAADWACFAEPAIWLIGKEEAIKNLPQPLVKLPEFWPIDQLMKNRIAPERTFLHTEKTHVAVMDENLDLAMALSKMSQTTSVAPMIVVGEGAHPDNHTLVKILGKHGVMELQFLAFPPEVRGGVCVESFGKLIAATPLASGAPAEIVLMNQQGETLWTIRPELAAPYVVSAVGEELAVASASGFGLHFYDGEGRVSRQNKIPAGRTSLSSDGDSLFVYSEAGRILTTIEPDGRTERVLTMLPPGRSVFASAFDDGQLWAGGPQADLSHVYEIKADGTHIGRDIGREENQFWLGLPKEWEQTFGPFKGKAKAKHIKFCEYGHIRVDSLSPRYRDPEAPDWAGDSFVAELKKRGLTKPLSAQPLRMWNPTFTHRMFPEAFKNWALAVDEKTGLRKYLQQSPTGGLDGPIDSNGPGFVTSTYAPGAVEMQSLYREPLRAFLQEWAPLYREQPWLAPSIEPNHEFESVVATDGGVGDYNPYMIEGFFDWLVRHYGSDLESWKARFGVNFDKFFDAPRGLGRGRWDRYDLKNPYFQAWEDYNRSVVNRTLALTYQESLAAGIPPEMIRSHQIPDSYAVAPVLKSGVSRITPIDYAMTAGVGFGFTKFGVNYDKPENIIKATQTSGFDSFVMGEFQPLNTDPEIAAKELRYVFASGAKAIHPLFWGAQHTQQGENPDDHKKNETVYNAIQVLLDEDPPRLGQAGGIGQVRAFRVGDRAFNVVSIGERGLLKSIRADGRMEGSVYVVPFHQQIRIESLVLKNGHVHIDELIGPGSQIEIRGSSDALAEVKVYRGDVELTDLRAELSGDFRYVLRIAERMEDLSIRLDGVIQYATLQSPEVADVHVGRHTGIPHRGGVTFDVLSN
jgi:hypothetical protein